MISRGFSYFYIERFWNEIVSVFLLLCYKITAKGWAGVRRVFLLRFQSTLPLGFFKSDEDKIVPDQKRAFDQHSVRSKKPQHLLLAHAGQLVLEFHGLVEQTAGIKKFLQRQTAATRHRRDSPS